MFFLIEGQTYCKEDLERVLPGEYSNGGKLDIVGYYYRHNPDGKGEPVFVLPKVFCGESSDEAKPIHVDFTDDDACERIDNSIMKKWNAKDFNELSCWIYGALDRYRERLQTNKIVNAMQDDTLKCSKNDESEKTLRDIIVALDNYYHRNKDLFVFIYKQTHSGYNKIDWDKTVRKCRPIITNDEPQSVAYADYVGYKKAMDNDEQLIVLFLSTLNYLARNGYYDFVVDLPYNLYSANTFDHMVESGQLITLLNRIKNNYFSDKLQELWHLLYAFYKREEGMREGVFKDEYLLSSSFDRVFEDMIDYLISDDDCPKQLLIQEGGSRIVDHLFLGDSLFGDKQIYYVGDSKYYSEGNKVDGADVYKQFDYVKNIVHQTKNSKLSDDNVQNYYDELTCGFNVSPNFFIRGHVENKYNMDSLNFVENKENIKQQRMFPDRLFDRSTLWLSEYTINIMYVMKVYSKQDEYEKEKTKEIVKHRVRDGLVKQIKKVFNVYKLTPNKNDDSLKPFYEMFIKHNLYKYNGMLFSPSSDICDLYFACLKGDDIPAEIKGIFMIGSV